MERHARRLALGRWHLLVQRSLPRMVRAGLGSRSTRCRCVLHGRLGWWTRQTRTPSSASPWCPRPTPSPRRPGDPTHQANCRTILVPMVWRGVLRRLECVGCPGTRGREAATPRRWHPQERPTTGRLGDGRPDERALAGLLASVEHVTRATFPRSIPDPRRGPVGRHGQALQGHRLGGSLRPEAAIRGERSGTHLSVQGSLNFKRDLVPAAVQGLFAIGLAQTAVQEFLAIEGGTQTFRAPVLPRPDRARSPWPKLRSCWRSPPTT